MYKRLKHRGALFIEYALMLSMICLVGIVFISGTSGSMAVSIAQIFHNAYDTFEGRNFNIAQWAAKAKRLELENKAGAIGNIIYSLNQGESIPFSKLSAEQKKALRDAGLCLEEIDQGAFYRNGGWYVVWTTENPSDSSKINYMVYALSGGDYVDQNDKSENAKRTGQYYVGTATKGSDPLTNATHYTKLASESGNKYETSQSAEALAKYNELNAK